jgi:thiosulfate/3-mercaptopyruvate sulfurtransferase
MAYTTLIDTETVAARLTDPDLAVIDCRFLVDNPAWGAAEYAAAHIPGAVFADMGLDLAGKKTGRNGRHPLPEPATLARTFGRLGIDARVQVAAYDQDAGMYASRLWWLLRWLGYEAVAVVDGACSTVLRGTI